MSVTAAYPTGTIGLFPRQRRFVQDPTKWLLATGGLGSGKSTVAMAKVVSRIGRPGLGMVVAPTYRMLQDATLRTLFGLLDQAGIPYTYAKSDHLITIPPSGHEIIARSAEEPDNLRGPDLDYVAVDELAYIREAAFRVLMGRVRRPNTQLWGATTPKGKNFVWAFFVRDAAANRELYRFRTDENPTLDPEFIADLGFTGSYAAQELEGEFVAFDGLVYTAFNRERHLRVMTEEQLHGWSCTLGVDVGARNPTAIITRRQSGAGAVHLEHEVYVRNLSATDIVAAVVEEFDRCVAAGHRPDRVYVDPSAAGTIADLERRLTRQRVERADNDRRHGVQVCQSTLAGVFSVDPSCLNFISEIETYHYPDDDKKRSGDARLDDPVKEHDHILDGWRYAEMGAATPRKRVRAW